MNRELLDTEHVLHLKRLGINTSQEAVIYMREDCAICRSEGFAAHARVKVELNGRSIIATINVVTSAFLSPGEAGLSEAAFHLLRGSEGERITIHHPSPLNSLSAVRSKVYGNQLNQTQFSAIAKDIAKGRYSDIHLSAFLTGCAGENLNRAEIVALTRSMIDVGDRIDWGRSPIVDKHCVGGLPGNRTTPIIVAIAAACGLTMPKTSSRAITSPAGTADAMETLAPVELSIDAMRKVVENEGGCVVWGGGVNLSPIDDILIRIERVLDLDSEGQLVASVLSKKAAAGSTHLVLDLPVGPSAKVRSSKAARSLSDHLIAVAECLGIKATAMLTDGLQPVGAGIGPALEAQDVLSVLKNEQDAPVDLHKRAVTLAGEILELASKVPSGQGVQMAHSAIVDGGAWNKFQAICDAQGGMKTPPHASQTFPIEASRSGRISAFDNRLLSRIAKLSGAPGAPAAGLKLHKKIGDSVSKGEPLYTIHAETPGEINYALEFVRSSSDVIVIEEIR